MAAVMLMVDVMCMSTLATVAMPVAVMIEVQSRA